MTAVVTTGWSVTTSPLSMQMVDRSETGTISTIVGHSRGASITGSDRHERDPLRLSLPWISSLDYANGRLFVPTDLADDDNGELAILVRH